MEKYFTFLSSDGITQIHATEWIPDGEIKAILQISHGMVEFIGRYARFAEYLNQYGIYVVGNDHLGHGRSVNCDEEHGYFGHPDGNKYIIRDLHRLRKITEKKHPGIPYFMLGHSMGSFMIRQYMMIHGEGLSGVIVMGTGAQPEGTLVFGKLLCTILAHLKGWEYRSKLVDTIVSAANNKRIAPLRTPKDWLTKDEKIVDAYIAEPWCSFTFTLDGFYHMFSAIQFIQRKQNIRHIPKKLPIFIVSGEEDPIGNYGKGVKAVYDSYVKAGIYNLRMKLYPGDRHEILNELDYENVFADLKDWIENIYNHG